MNIIRQEEELLFDKWILKYQMTDKSFMKDGCPNPAVYEKESCKIVFVLKDGNMGGGEPGQVYDQRNELEFNPDPWWRVIARWCYFIKFPSASWDEGHRAIDDTESVRDALSSHCFMQLKKSWGVGSVSNEALDNVITEDKTEILEQLAIYVPDFIIACGNGDHLSRVFDCKQSDRKTTINGVGFWHISLAAHQAVLIDYCHPSNRMGTKVHGMVSRGLASTIAEIAENYAYK